MYPTICKIGPVTVHSYGLMLAVAVIICTFLLSRQAKKDGISSDIIYDLVFSVIIGGIVGARLFYILLNLQYFQENPLEMIMIQKGGLAVQGGLLCGFFAGIWYLKRKKVSVPKMLDLAAPYIALGQSIGRIGCFLNGCCFGKVVSWGIYFPVHQAHLYPTQLYLSAGYLFIFGALLRFGKKKPGKGRVFILYVMLACILRFFVEFFRADHNSHMFYGLSIYQIVSLIIFTAAFIFAERIKKLENHADASH